MCPSCRSKKSPSAQKGRGEHGTYDNGRLTEDYVCSLERVGRERGPKEEGDGDENDENEPGMDGDAVVIGSCCGG